MKRIIYVGLLLFFINLQGQELFALTEPASTMSKGSVSVRFSNAIYKRIDGSGYNHFFMPKLMWGVHKRLIVNASLFASTRSDQIKYEGVSIYSKYRFFSVDDLRSHFRMAGFARYSVNNTIVNQEEIDITRYNSGYELGLIATQLLNKIAISSSLSFKKALNNNAGNIFPAEQGSYATNFSLSFGKLIHPVKYDNFKQTNINLMLEFLGQTINQNGKSYLDVAPTIQFIVKSQTRIDLGVKKEILSSMTRISPNGIFLNLEHTFF